MNTDATLWPDGLSMLRAVPPATLLHAIANASTYVEAADAANECEHGCLSTDRPENRDRAGCTCWDRVRVEEATEPRRKPAIAVRSYGEAMARLQTPPTRYVLDLPPFIANMADELDDRIADLLAEAGRVRALKEALTNGE